MLNDSKLHRRRAAHVAIIIENPIARPRKSEQEQTDHSPKANDGGRTVFDRPRFSESSEARSNTADNFNGKTNSPVERGAANIARHSPEIVKHKRRDGL